MIHRIYQSFNAKKSCTIISILRLQSSKKVVVKIFSANKEAEKFFFSFTPLLSLCAIFNRDTFMPQTFFNDKHFTYFVILLCMKKGSSYFFLSLPLRYNRSSSFFHPRNQHKKLLIIVAKMHNTRNDFKSPIKKRENDSRPS